MSRYLQFVLVLVYAVYSYWLFVFCTGLDKQYAYMPFWLAFCFSGAWWSSPFYFLFSRARKPILEEEKLLRSCLDELLPRLPRLRRVRLLVEPTESLTMFATGTDTIGFSMTILKVLEPEEIKAVLAHELGHLTTYDTLASGAFHACTFLPKKLSQGVKLLYYFILSGHLLLVLPIITILVTACTFLAVRGYGLLSLRILLFLFAFVRLQFIFKLLQNMIARYNEYRQDAFAHKLGYGLALKSALIKLMGESPVAPSAFENFLFGVHPITYNRIRRLEKLEGLRTDG